MENDKEQCEVNMSKYPPKEKLVPLDENRVREELLKIYHKYVVTERMAKAICSKFGTPAPKEKLVELDKLKICKEALWKIAIDYHEDNPDRHINPVSPDEVASQALIAIGDMKNDE